MPVFVRYLVFQLPSWMLASVVLGLLAWYETLPAGVAAALLAALVAKDLLLFPRLRHAYTPGPTDGAAAMCGALVEVDTPLRPEGYVRFGAERWQARLADSNGRVDAGETVRVREVDRLTLLVEPCRSPAAPIERSSNA